jgi:cell division protein FtsQ
MKQMAIHVNIRKLLYIVLWSVAGCFMLVLLVAAIKLRNNKTCAGYRIDIKGSGTGQGGGTFIGRKEVENMLTGMGAGAGGDTRTASGMGTGPGRWIGRPILSFDLPRMESVLEKNAWIRDAQLFFDNNGILRVNVSERMPIARVFTTAGGSCYIDSSGIELPLSDRLTARLPVFTGYPAERSRLHGADSLVSVQVRWLSAYIGKDPFWMAQIAQVDITPARIFEMAPLVGDHLIVFGDGNDYEQKFHRLFIFYKEVLSRTGFDKYSRIDVQYAGQVIGTRKGSGETQIDSLQGMRNIRQLIRTAQQLQPDTAREQNMRPLERSQQSEQTLTGYDLVPDNEDSGGTKPRAIMPGKKH